MKARVAVISVVAILLPFLCPAQDMKLPVFFLRYDGGVGSEGVLSARMRDYARARQRGDLRRGPGAERIQGGCDDGCCFAL